MDATKFVFTGNDQSNGNVAVRALTDRLLSVTDSREQKIWKSVQSGIALPTQDIFDVDAPAIWIYEQLDQHIASPSNLFCDVEIIHTVSLYCYLYINPDLHFDYKEVQPIRRNITRATLKHLNGTMANNPNGFNEGLPNWYFVKPQVVNVDYTDVLKPHYPNVSVDPDWWLWRIDLSMKSLNTSTNGA